MTKFKAALGATALTLFLAGQSNAQFLPPSINVGGAGGASPRAHQMKGDARNAAGQRPATTTTTTASPTKSTNSSGKISESKKEREGTPTIHRSAADGRTQSVREAILTDPQAVRTKDSQGFTALHHAAVGGHVETVQMLLEKGAMLEWVGSRGESALYLAASKGHADVVKVLLEAGADPNRASATQTTPLHKAAMEGDLATVNLLLEAGADVKAEDRSGRTALDLAERYRAGEYSRVMDALRRAEG